MVVKIFMYFQRKSHNMPIKFDTQPRDGNIED